MKAIWKEFFRLKVNEIWEFIKRLPKIILTGVTIFGMCIGVAIIVLATFYGIGIIMLWIFPKSYDIAQSLFQNRIETGFVGFLMLLMITGIIAAIAKVFVSICNWLISNWRQAKRNV